MDIAVGNPKSPKNTKAHPMSESIMVYQTIVYHIAFSYTVPVLFITPSPNTPTYSLFPQYHLVCCSALLTHPTVFSYSSPLPYTHSQQPLTRT